MSELPQSLYLLIYCLIKRDIAKDPMKSISFVPKTITAVGWGRMGGSCRGGEG